MEGFIFVASVAALICYGFSKWSISWSDTYIELGDSAPKELPYSVYKMMITLYALFGMGYNASSNLSDVELFASLFRSFAYFTCILLLVLTFIGYKVGVAKSKKEMVEAFGEVPNEKGQNNEGE